MGRIYQTMTQGRVAVDDSARLKVVPVPLPPDEVNADEDVELPPYIEVGGPEPISNIFARPTTTTTRPIERTSSPITASRPRRVIGIAFRAVPGNGKPLAPADQRLGEGLIAYHEPAHPVSAQYRGLALEIADQLPGLSARVIGLTAALPESGTTTVALNLGLTLAREKQRVIIVDGHVERPMVATALGLSIEPGLCDLLANQVPLSWALHPTGIERLTALPIGRRVPELDPDALTILIEQLRRRFDWIIVDGAPVVDLYDGVYLTTRHDDLNRAEVADTHESIVQYGGKLRGYILTTG